MQNQRLRHWKRKWKLFSKNHRCSPPWGIKDVKCKVKGERGKPEVTYAKLCSKYAKLRRPLNQNTLAFRDEYKTMLENNGGTLLLHSWRDKAISNMWCEPNKKQKVAYSPKYSLSKEQRGKSCDYLEREGKNAKMVNLNNPKFQNDQNYDTSVTVSSTCKLTIETCGILPPRGSLQSGLTLTETSFIKPITASVIASGSYGQVSRLMNVDGTATILKTPKLMSTEINLSKKDKEHNEKHNENAIQLLRSELMVGNAVCSLALPCAQGTPVVQYKGCVFFAPRNFLQRVLFLSLLPAAARA
jgi:hypothetical protein